MPWDAAFKERGTNGFPCPALKQMKKNDTLSADMPDVFVNAVEFRLAMAHFVLAWSHHLLQGKFHTG